MPVDKKQDLLKQAHDNMNKLYDVETQINAASVMNAKALICEYVALNRSLLANLFNLLSLDDDKGDA